MNLISFQEIVDIVRNNRNINFLATSVTPWHAIGVDASIRFLQKRGIEPKGLCLVLPHPITGFVCDETIFTNNKSLKYCCYANYKLYNKIKDAWLYYKFIFLNTRRRKNRLFYIISSQYNIKLASIIYSVMPHVHIKFIIIDEGVATYMNTLVPKITEIRTFVSLIQYINYNIVGKFVRNESKYINNRLFLVDKNNNLCKNSLIIPFYEYALGNKAKSDAITIASNFSSSVLICTTAWEREEIMDNEDLMVLKRICDFLHNKKINIYIKPHPRDTFFINHIDELHSEIVNYSCPVESLCFQCPPKAIISFSSTALITANLFWNIPAFCITDLLDRTKIGDKYIEEIDSFKKVFHKMILFVKNEAEIKI